MARGANRPPLSPTRRAILVVGGGLLVGLAVVTIARAAPRRVALDVVVADPPEAGMTVRTVVTCEGEVVVEAEEEVRGRATLGHRLWLQPRPHEVEVRGRGCEAARRRFTPGEVDRVVVAYRCHPPE